LSEVTGQLEAIAEEIRTALVAKHEARERVLRLSREVIRNSANTIRAAHRREFDKAGELLAAARARVEEMEQAVQGHSDIRYAGYVDDAQKEFAEASLTVAFATGTSVPTPAQLKVANAPYLNGLGEAAGELRRYLLDALRRGEMARCEELLSHMDDIYNVLVTMDFPDALTGGLRRTTDMVRGVLERTRGDLTMSISQSRLEEKLGLLGQQLQGKNRERGNTSR